MWLPKALERLSFIPLAGIILGFLTAIVLGWGNPRFLVNDDWRMRTFADGTFTGEPEIELVFVGKLQAFSFTASTQFPRQYLGTKL
jgi:hypothetical protein